MADYNFSNPGVTNGIIQMMIANWNNKNAQADREQQAQAHKDLMAQGKRANDINDLREQNEAKRIELEHDTAAKTLENAHDLAQSLVAQRRTEALYSSAKALNEGSLKPSAFQKPDTTIPPIPALGIGGGTGGGTPQGMMDIPEYGRIPVSSIASPEELEARRMQAVGNTVTATGAAQAPFLDTAAARTRETNRLKEVQEAADRQAEAKISGDRQIQVGQNRDAAELAAARIRGGYEMQGIKLRQQLGGQDDQGTLSFMQQNHEAIMNGQRDYKSLSPLEKRAEDGYAASIGELPPTDGKKYSDSLDAIARVQEQINQARNLAINYSHDSPGALQKGNATVSMGPLVGTHGFIVPGSDLDSQQKNLDSMVGESAKMFEGQSRTTKQTIERSGAGLFDPNATMKQNLEKVNSHIDTMRPIVNNALPQSMSADRKNVILHNRGIQDFGAYSSNQKASQTIPYSANGRTYAIPPEHEQGFLQLNPGAQKLNTPTPSQVPPVTPVVGQQQEEE